ncbi:hypothetical protein N7533_012934 [Penicillium manginii]|uniref:uncharacterized protein n=1 Tax=Penicillium manginii TaxID=203109 RepID=UPI002546BD1B|nr:uncharacterized protein N7533_013792 [Penicillium manginii]XP_056953169.1 uncharacterized protein N7533_012934 [Penicillium manginii]KAJ5733345.1 hypothetical protein N7533_013792 [Penicillium manginii]KAJ5734531.1 hypothetical protein N7533_012934 [Penicillium manginii]
MSSNLPTQTNTSPVISRNRNSFLSKFRSPLGNRNRSVTDYYIDLDDPWRSYFPGDVIKGTVIVTVVRPVRITHIVVCLHGFVKVFKNAMPAGEAAPDLGYLGPGRGRRGAEYMGNGLASLFEDEVVLCGDGRLKEGIYKFRFEMSLPPYALPSSINFERGTISYSLTSTLTRPTTMNPTLTCRRRVNLLENIDIAPFPAPKARIVTLEPISKRSKSKAKAKSVASDATQGPDTSSIDTPISGTAASVDNRPPLSPSPSNVSSSSRPSNSSQSFHIASDPSSSTSTGGGRNSEGRSATPSVSDRTITAKAEVLRAGVLPGDTLPIKVTINHFKQVRSAQGIVVTFYRQGRIDLHPAIPIGSTANGKKPVYEDCYPRSRTGLGGLTLGTSRTSSTFRKDLSQTFAPLIVDPTNMTATVKTSIRVPEDAFPTITRVPGAMINFRYYVEVVVDLRGKITSTDRFIPRFKMVSGGSNFSPSGQVLNPADANGSNLTANWAGNILDTDHIRREKGVISVAFEVVVGTRDSQRGQASIERTTSNVAESTTSQNAQPVASAALINPVDGEEWPEASPMPVSSAEYGQEDYGFPEGAWSEYPEDYHEYPQPIGPMMAHPEVEEPVDEKTRLRRHEEALLPGAPDEDEAGPSNAEVTMPTAPVLPEDHLLQDYQHLPSPVTEGVPHAGPHPVRSAESLQTIVINGSAPEASEPSAPGEDKQELERQRLLDQTSAPSAPPEEPNGSGTANVNGHAHGEPGEGPSAPVFDEDDQLVGGTAHADESLPRYQR